ncbi:MAG: zinc-binding dehydrogenase [Candidatus Kariarchaeaceae archaeon]|jgi:NADPH:quinone reductase-like Zn-dependent oxidoreductase
MMKAAIFREHGPVENLEIAEVEIPTIGDQDILVAVKAVALNRLDIWVRNGFPALKIQLPHIGGSDFAGIVQATGKDVKNVITGDRVVINAGLSCKECAACKHDDHSNCEKFILLGEHVWGGTGEFARVPATNVMKIPDHITFEMAAATSLTGLTVYRMLVTRASIKSGERILVIGAGGGIGTMAVQMATVFGGKVIALTSSKEKEEIARKLGAEHVINYKDQPEWGKEVWTYTQKRGVDIVVDSVGEVVFEQAIRSLAKGGRYVTCGATSGNSGKVNLALLFWKQLSILGSTMASDSEFQATMELLFSGKITPVIDSVRPIEEIQEAHRRLESSEHSGKIVLTL